MIDGTGVSVVVPCFNEGARLAGTIDRLHRVLDECVPQRWELVVVDDSSTDDTRAVAEAAAAVDARIRVVSPNGKGKGAAVRCGMLAASGELVLVTDADLAAGPEQLPLLLERIGDAAAAIGTRVGAGAVVDPPRPWGRRLPAAVFRGIARAVGGLHVSDPQCGFKLFRRDAVAAHVEALVTEGFAYEVELLLRLQRAGARVVEVPIRWAAGSGSGIRVVRDGLAMARDVAAIRRLVPVGAMPAGADELAVSVVMPVYNEAAVVETVVKEVRHHVLDAVDGGTELIIVDDHGTDGSSAIVAGLAAADDRVRVLVNDRNVGHGPSVLRGLDAARGRWRLQLDSDGQVDLADFAAFWAERASADLVIGSRSNRNDPRHRLVLSRGANALVSLLVRRRVRDSNAGFKLISADLYRHLRATIPSDTFAPSLLFVVGAERAGARVAVVPVVHRPRPSGTSSLRLWKLARAMALAAVQTVRYGVRPVGRYRR